MYIYIYMYISGWWLSPTPLKNDRVKVSWDDDIPDVPNHQPDIYIYNIQYLFFASHKPQLQLSAESNCLLSASQNETDL